MRNTANGHSINVFIEGQLEHTKFGTMSSLSVVTNTNTNDQTIPVANVPSYKMQVKLKSSSDKSKVETPPASVEVPVNLNIQFLKETPENFQTMSFDEFAQRMLIYRH